MKTVHFLLPVLIGISACTEPEPIELVPDPVEYQVRLEVECDSCNSFYAINGIVLNNEGDSVFGIYSLDTTIFEGEGISITALAQYGESDTIKVRILSDGVILSDSIDYKESIDDLSVVTYTVHVFE